MRRSIILGLMLGLAAPAIAQEHQHTPDACAAIDAKLPAGLEDWQGDAPVRTVGKAEDLTQNMLVAGKGYKAVLNRTTSVFMQTPPEKPGGSTSYAGLFRFDVNEAGNYAVALGGAAWIDVVEGGKSLEPVSFVHGPECTTIRKMVVFALKPGMHVLLVSGNAAEEVRLIVAKQP